MLEKELEILSSLDHPNIIQFFEFYQDNIYFHIIMELCTGPELFKHIIENPIMEERAISDLVFKIVGAIYYSHLEGVTHRDLKLENIMYENISTTSQIKIIDWGLSSKFQTGKPLSTLSGTYQYIAPEVFIGQYSNLCDIWSIGVITYVLFTRGYPFAGNDIKEYLINLLKDEVKYNLSYFTNVSKSAINFISRCLEKDQYSRISINQCLEHEWFHQNKRRLSGSKLDTSILQNLRLFEKPKNLLKSFIYDNFIKLILTPNEINLLRDQFQYMDLNGEGYINMEDLTQAYKRANIEINENEINDIIHNVDNHNNKKLNYSEFLIAAVDEKKIIEKENLIKVFNYFDEDNSGFIDKKNLKSLLQRTVKSKMNIYSDEQFLGIISEVSKKNGDSERTDKIYLKEFLGFFGVDE